MWPDGGIATLAIGAGERTRQTRNYGIIRTISDFEMESAENQMTFIECIRGLEADCGVAE